MQSADVALAPRQSRTQVLHTLNLRLVGPELAQDYSRIGPDVFTLYVEHLVAGERKDVLFSAESLLDLLQSGAARIYSNQRGRRRRGRVGHPGQPRRPHELRGAAQPRGVHGMAAGGVWAGR